MNMTDERTTAYLLNELPEPEAEQFEEQCFTQPEWPDVELDSAEADLIHAYIKNELSPERRRRFEENYLTTEARRERVLLARSFLRVVCSVSQPKLTRTQRLFAFVKSLAFAPQFAVPRLAMILVTVGLIAIVSWLAIRTKPPQTFAEVNLAMSTETRSTSRQVERVKLPLGKDALRITLAFPEPVTQGATYRVEWEDLKGPLKNLEIEKQEANSVSVIIPAGDLTPGQYMLKLFRKSPNETTERMTGNYYFIVE